MALPSVEQARAQCPPESETGSKGKESLPDLFGRCRSAASWCRCLPRKPSRPTPLRLRFSPLPATVWWLNGGKVSFVVAFNGMTINHDGVIGGGEIKLKTKSDQADFPADDMTLKRCKEHAVAATLRGGDGEG